MFDRRYEYFFTIVKLKSFAKTAEEMYVSPPAITKQIKSLENSLGFKLFERSNKGAILTRAGEAFYAKARVLYQAFHHAVDESRAIAACAPTVLKIGTLNAECHRVLPAICVALKKSFPSMEFKYHATEYESATAAILDHTIDFFIKYGSDGIDSKYIKKHLLYWSYPNVIAVESGELTDKATIKMQDLRHKTLIFPAKGCSEYYDQLRMEIEQISPYINIVTTPETDAFYLKLKTEQCFSICPSLFEAPGSEYKLIPMELSKHLKPMRMDIVMRNQSESFGAMFIQIARQAILHLMDDELRALQISAQEQNI